MAVKTTGAEFARFYNDDTFWPEGTWHEDEVITVEGKVLPDGQSLDEIPENMHVTVADGYIHDPFDGKEHSMESYFKKWRKTQSIVVLMVEFDKTKVDAEALKAAIKTAGGKVVT